MTRNRMRMVSAASLALVVGLGSAGCSFNVGSNLDVQKAENEIAKGIEEQTDVVVTVDCPETVLIQTGGTFTCTATGDNGETATVLVTQKDDQGNVSWELQQ